MTDRNTTSGQLIHRPPPPPPRPAMHNNTTSNTPFLQRLRHRSLHSTQLMGIMALLISASILLLLTGVTITVTALTFVFFSPLIILTSPIWVPFGALMFVVIAGVLSVFGTGLATAATIYWLYKYFKGLHPVGSDRVDYARSRLADTASHVKDYAREYGGYFQSKVKDAAPGA